jgi:hypothetical protein
MYDLFVYIIKIYVLCDIFVWYVYIMYYTNLVYVM